MRADSPIRRPSSAPTQPTSPAGAQTGSGAPEHVVPGPAPRRASMDGMQAMLPPRTPAPIHTRQPAGTSTSNAETASVKEPASPAREPAEPPQDTLPKPGEKTAVTPASRTVRRPSTDVLPSPSTAAGARLSVEASSPTARTASLHESVPPARTSADKERRASSEPAHETTPAPVGTTLAPRASSDVRPAEEPALTPKTGPLKKPAEPLHASTSPAPKAPTQPPDEITAAGVERTAVQRATSETSSPERAALLGDIAQRMEAASRRPVAEPPDIFSVIGRMERAAELLSRRFAPDEALRHRTAPPELVAAQQRLQHVLDALQPDPTQNPDEQRELKRLYIKENAPIEAAWSVLFGEGYVPGQAMRAPFSEGSINAAFEFVRGGISSFMRSPARNGAATEWRPRPGDRLTLDSVHTVDANAAGGAIGGLGSYTFEKAIESSMLKQAATSNLPMLVPIPPELLAPPPGRVRQTSWRSEDGAHVVRFHIAGLKDESARFEDSLPGGAPHLPRLDSDAQRKRESIATWQQAWNAEHYAALLQPFLTACLNSLQPEILSEAAREQGGSVFAVSAFGSALAGALAGGSLNLAKATPYLGQVRVKDAMDQPQWLNMYLVAGRNVDPSADLARWSDALHLPAAVLKTAGNTLVEAVKLPKELVLDPLHAIPDLLLRHVFPNGLVGVVAPAAAEAALEPVIQGATAGLLGNASAALARTRVGLASGLNDYMWPMLRDKMNPLKARTDVRRKERQDIKAADRTRLEANRQRLDDQLRQQQGRVPQLLHAATGHALGTQDCAFIGEMAGAAHLGMQHVPRLRQIADQLPPDTQLSRELLLMASGVEQRARIDRKLAPPWTARLTGGARGGTSSVSPA